METQQAQTPEVPQNQSNQQLKKKSIKDLVRDDPRRYGIIGIVGGIISLFVLPMIAGVTIAMGVLGVYFSVKNKSPLSTLLINIVSICIGIASLVLWLSVYGA